MKKKLAQLAMGCCTVMAMATGGQAFASEDPVPYDPILYTGKDHTCTRADIQFNATIKKEVADKGGVVSLMAPFLSSKPHESMPTKLFYGTHLFAGAVKGEMVNGSDKWYVVHNWWADTYMHSSNFEDKIECNE
ncbi:hypothetical protein J2Z48_001807 [Croceifilum oryzae]|uniref:Uncharacterized protein n=1 Tax=Croceifilum oryzae TaxID=1553429 RepID=A0AAJ1TKA7_9BACL|nr:hypothetical protein [Croceifilum oryzae]MDQ0417634.1 hypothetical protein [Croceifilum oryzae]